MFRITLVFHLLFKSMSHLNMKYMKFDKEWMDMCN